VVLKVASDKEDSRQHGINSLSYEREVRFYEEFGKQLPTIPDVYATALDQDGLFTIVMEDFAMATQIDNLVGCEPDVAKKVLSALAHTQGPRMGDWMWAGQIPWLNKPQVYNAGFAKKMWPMFKRKYGDRLPKEQVELYEWFADHALDWEAAVIPRKSFLTWYKSPIEASIQPSVSVTMIFGLTTYSSQGDRSKSLIGPR
jgi:hypothetical protein